MWTSQYYYVNPDLSGLNGRDECENWHDMETVVPEEEIPCPPTLDRAQLPNSGLIAFSLRQTLYDDHWLETFHQGAAACFKQALVIQLR